MLARLTGVAADATISGLARQSVSVLLVDDLASFRRAAASVIAVVDGFTLAGEAGSGEEALAFLEQRSVGLVLMDVNMPGMGGIRAAERVGRRCQSRSRDDVGRFSVRRTRAILRISG